MHQEFHLNSFEKQLIFSVFKLRKGQLMIKNRFIRVLLYLKAGKPSAKTDYISVDELDEDVYQQLFDKGDIDKIIRFLEARQKPKISQMESKQKFDFALLQEVNKQVRRYYHFLPNYDHVGKRETVNSQILSIEHSLMILAFDLRGLAEDLYFFLSSSGIRLFGHDQAFRFDEEKREKWEKWFKKADEQNIPGILVPAMERQPDSSRTIPSAIKDIVSLFFLSTARTKSDGFIEYQQMLINFVLDRPNLDKEKVFILNSDRIMVDLFWKGLENLKFSDRKFKKIKLKVETELGTPVYMPFDLICFSIYKFEFCRRDADDSCSWDFENILIVFDYATKFILHYCYLTGDPGEFQTALRVLIQRELKVPKLIWLDPLLTSYAEECQTTIQGLELDILIQESSNFRLAHFLNFYVVRKEMFIKYKVVSSPEKDKNSYFVEVPLNVDYEEAIERFPELVLEEFNRSSDLNFSEPLGSPSDCYRKFKNRQVKTISQKQFALLFYSKVMAISNEGTCYINVGEFVYVYTLASIVEGVDGILLVDNYEMDAFLSINSQPLVDAKYYGKFISKDEKWRDEIIKSFHPPLIIDSKKEASRLLREELGIAPKSDADMLFEVEKSTKLRKDFDKLNKSHE